MGGWVKPNAYFCLLGGWVGPGKCLYKQNDITRKLKILSFYRVSQHLLNDCLHKKGQYLFENKSWLINWLNWFKDGIVTNESIFKSVENADPSL